MSTQLSIVKFHDQPIVAVEHEGQPYVSMKQICDNLDLERTAQIRRIKRHPVLSKGCAVIALPTTGGIQEAFCLPLSLLNGWLFGIEASRVRPEIRARLIQYQEECFDVLYRYFTNQRQIPAQQSSEARQRSIRLKLLDVLKKETDPIIRGTLIAELDDLTRQLGLPGADFAKIGYEAPPQPERLTEFWEQFEFVVAQGEALNLANTPNCLAINIPQVRAAFEKHQQAFNFAGIHSLLRLSKTPKYEGYSSVNSRTAQKSVKCWIFSEG